MAKIFIGSSKQMIPLVEEVAGCLKSEGHEPLPWTDTFKGGDITIDRLLDLASEIDGAILVFSGDDKVESQKGGIPQARGNILIECGLFLGRLGRHRAIILNRGENRKPSDLDGLIWVNAGNKAHGLNQEAQKELSAWALALDEVQHPFEGTTKVFSSFPKRRFREKLQQAKCLHILQTFIPYILHLESFEDDLLEAITRGCKVQVLISSPWSPVVKLRQVALNTGYGRDIVTQQIRTNLEHFAALASKLAVDKCADRLEVRVHTAMPSMSIYRVDDLFFSGHYFQDKLAIDGPQLLIKNLKSGMGKRLVREHSQIWQAETTRKAPLHDLENWLKDGPEP